VILVGRLFSGIIRPSKWASVLIPARWVAQHVTGGVGRYQLPAQFVQWSPIIVSNRYDVALSPSHAWYFFVQDDGLAVAD
jgi:hypothetical protein